MPKYNYSNPFELGRIAFASGLPETDKAYFAWSPEDAAAFAQGWDFEYKCNLVRTLKVYEKKPVPQNLQWYDRPCINKHYVDQLKFLDAIYV